MLTRIRPLAVTEDERAVVVVVREEEEEGPVPLGLGSLVATDMYLKNVPDSLRPVEERESS